MRLAVDSSLCEAHGACSAVSEDLFPLDDEGYSAVGNGTDVPNEHAALARAGVDACPMVALRLEQ
jgi:ferredoxin